MKTTYQSFRGEEITRFEGGKAQGSHGNGGTLQAAAYALVFQLRLICVYEENDKNLVG